MDTAQAPEEETTVNETDPQASANRLVLPSLEIKNFRAFRHLTIEKLGRVNLITGKNNVGKTSLLEALTLLAERDLPQATLKMLLNRNERVAIPNGNVQRYVANGSRREKDYELLLQFGSLFYGRIADINEKKQIFIGDRLHRSGLVLYIDWFTEAALENKLHQVGSVDPDLFTDAVACIVFGDGLIGFHGGHKKSLAEIINGVSHTTSQETKPYRFISSCGLTNLEQSLLWDRIHLTDIEEKVEDALRILSPQVKRIAFIQSAEIGTSRVPIVRMEGSSQAIPLRSLGEGVNRMLGYILSAANVVGGILLIDEIENGLHYSVLPDVWRLIFQTAHRLNVQVFATTHSWDCIEAFQQAASEDDAPTSGVLVRLRNKDGDIISTVFDEEELAIITRQQIEVR